MAHIFPRWTNKVPMLAGVGGAFAFVGVTLGVWYYFSPEFTDVGYSPPQPVAFSHRQHAGELGLDCRYCHNTVERAAKAAVPPTTTCMNCHTKIHKESAKLAKVRESHKTGRAIPWVRVHMLPDYAFFDHSAHMTAGVGCVSCHGRVDEMDKVRQVKPLSMSWCLECHRNAKPNLRPRSEITNMTWTAAAANYDPDSDPQRKNKPLNPPIHCSGCHR